MIKLTVQQYANENNTNVQQVYRRIKKGDLTTTKVNGKTLIVTNSKRVKKNDSDTQSNSSLEEFLIQDNKTLKKQVKMLNKKIDKLNKKLESKNDKVEQTLLTYISELKQLQVEHRIKDDVEIVTKKKKKKSKKDKE